MKFHRTIAPLLAAFTLAATWRSQAGQAPPHNISALNATVVQNDTANNESSVTVSQTLSVNNMRLRIGSNRGDVNLQIGDEWGPYTGATNFLAQDGFPFVAIPENGRYNLDEQSEPFYGAPSFDGSVNAQTGIGGYWAALGDCTADRAEYNVNAAVAYFRYTNWLSGWARNVTSANGGTNNLFTGSPGLLLGNHFRGISGGRSRVDLRSFGFYSTGIATNGGVPVTTNSGVLLVTHAKNEGNFGVGVSNPDGTWELFVKDNFGTAATPFALEQDPVAFVFIPKTNTYVVSGKFGLDDTGTNATILSYSGNSPAFSVENIAAGRYRLTIPGGSPTAGVLIASPEATYTNGNYNYVSNIDNVISYQADGDGWIIESRDTGVYPPVLEATTNGPVAVFIYIPASTPGFTITPTNTLINTLVTTEYGLSTSFNVQLDLAPTDEVTVAVSSSNPAEGIVSTNLLVFNPTNWNIPQTITITGQDDGAADGNVSYSIILDAAVSTDPNYNGLNPADVAVINTDDEQSGISVTPTAGLLTTESGGNTTFSIILNRQPTADVVIGLSSSSTAEGTVLPASLTFSPLNWSTPQVVTVTGANDFKQDGNKTFSVITAPAVSADASYNNLNPADITVVNQDNDAAGYLWTYTLPVTVIEGSTATYTLALGTQPEANVIITNTSSNPTTGATVSPATLTFTPLNWNIPQVITLTGIDNLVTNASVSFTINHQPASTDPVYSQMISTIPVAAVLIDNEAKFALPSGDCIYGLGMPAIGIDGQATIDDVDAISYNSGSVTAALTANGQAQDRLEIRNTGTLPGQISVTGSDVSYGGTIIGTFAGGASGTPLAINLNANASVIAVQQLIRSITFSTATNASFVTRTLSVTLNDGLGFTGAASKAIRVGALRMTQYQEGADNGYGEYSGAVDLALSEVGYFTPWPAGRTPAPQEGLLIDWPDGGTPNESQVLLRFDDFVGPNYWQVPSNAVVVSAELLINVNNTGDGGRFFRMLLPWDGTNDTWSSWGEGVQADDVEANSIYTAQLGTEDGSGATGVGMLSVGVTADVQAWVSGTNNYGWVIKGWPLMTDGTGYTPSEFSVITERPRLRVKWLVPGYNSVSFQQGVDGYAGTYDTNLRQANPDAVSNADLGISSDWNDAGNTNTTESLIRFEGIIGTDLNQIPPGSIIHGAFLDLSSSGSDAMGDGGEFHAVLQPWDDVTTTWNSWGGNGIQADGIESLVTPTAVFGNASLNPDVQATLNTIEVTTDLQAWVNGERPNYGWVLLPFPNGSNAWISRSADFMSVVDPNNPNSEHPRLRVYYTAGTGALPARLKALVTSLTQVQVPFTGTIGKTYTVQRAPAVTGPWSPLGTATTDGSGAATFTDSAPLSDAAFYRVVYP